MGKSVVDNNTVIPRNVKTLFGKPAVVRTETKIYNELLSAFAQELKPKDIFEWMYVADLAYYRANIQHLRRIMSQFPEYHCNKNANARLTCLLKNHYDMTYVPFFDRSQKEYQQTIKDLDKNDPELAKIKVEYENKITAKADKLNEEIEKMTEEVERDSLSYDNQAGSFHSWSADYQAIERSLALFEKGYKDAMCDFEEHRYGLGERLREAKIKIIDVEPEKNSSAAAKAAAPIEPQIAAKDEIGSPPQSSTPPDGNPPNALQGDVGDARSNSDAPPLVVE